MKFLFAFVVAVLLWCKLLLCLLVSSVSNFQTYNFSNSKLSMFKLADFQTFKRSNFQTFKRSNGQAFKRFRLSNFGTFKLSNFQTFQVFKLSRFHLFLLDICQTSNLKLSSFQFFEGSTYNSIQTSRREESQIQVVHSLKRNARAGG